MSRANENKGISVGISLMLVAIIIVCLVAFSVLTFSSAESDYQLSSQVMKRKLEYTEACNIAEECLMELDSLLADCRAESDSSEDYIHKIVQAGECDKLKDYVIATQAGADSTEMKTQRIRVYEFNPISEKQNVISSEMMICNTGDEDKVGRLSFSVEINDKESLMVSVDILYNDGEEQNGNYRISEYYTSHIQEEIPDSGVFQNMDGYIR